MALPKGLCSWQVRAAPDAEHLWPQSYSSCLWAPQGSLIFCSHILMVEVLVESGVLDCGLRG